MMSKKKKSTTQSVLAQATKKAISEFIGKKKTFFNNSLVDVCDRSGKCCKSNTYNTSNNTVRKNQ